MDGNMVTAIPEEYFGTVSKELQGTFTEVTYPVNHYINKERQLVTNQKITPAMAGRETVPGEAILKKCNIYLPAAYDKENTRYNVLYLLHGVGGNRYEWPCGSGNADGNHVICNLLDHLISNGDIDPLIVVFPDGRSAWDWTDTSFTSEGTNMLGFYYFDYELRYDLIPFIESEYRTCSDINDKSQGKTEADRRHRAIAGLSMGGMQALNLALGGYRYDSTQYTKSASRWKNGLDRTVQAPGMLDLFSYVGAFSNAPTTSAGGILGTGLASGPNKLEVLYLTCGDADGVAYEAGYKTALEGLAEAAGDKLGELYEVIIRDGAHDFSVWNNGAYNFLRIISEHPSEQTRKASQISRII
ncbi:S-formylglutathione hydrolase FrmB [Anaerotaenia torta]|uniref:alpha/beta hydrolase n=1 Tax=Anaerotaenia torta TaxID=433293 RepID=UPI003D2422FF